MLWMSAVPSACADESDDEQDGEEEEEGGGRMPSVRISTSMVKQATAHLHKDGRYGMIHCIPFLYT